MTERRTFAPSELRTSDVDYADVARRMKTSELILALNEESILETLREAVASGAATAEQARLAVRPLVEAIAAELDARIPARVA